MDALLRDLRQAAHALRRAPGFTAVAAVTIALGIAATTVVFSLVSALLLTPLPVASPERLVTVHEVRSGAVAKEMGYSVFPYARYEAYRDASRDVFAGLAGHGYGEASLRLDGPAEVVNTVTATANYFDVLGLRPALGGFFAAGAERSADPAAVISHELWTTRFGGDPSVVGRWVHVDSRRFTIAGVAPRGFGGTVVGLPVDLWLPAQAGDGSPGSGDRLILFGRLRGELTPRQASAALAVVSAQVPPDHATTEIVGVDVRPLTGVPTFFRGPLIGFMTMLLATAGLVLLIASTNVGGMLLARSIARRREIAIRLAIGAGRGRLVQQFLAESVLLFALGAAMGVLLTIWLVRLASAFQPPVPVRVALEFGVDARVLAFAAALALATGVVFGLAPALAATRRELLPALKDGERGGAQRTRLRGAFVVAQLAMSLLLLITAGLFARTLQQALAAEIGFDPDGVVVAGVNLRPHGFDEERGRALEARLLERVRSVPGVEGAAFAVWAPMGGNVRSETVQRDGAAADAEEEQVSANIGTVGSGFLETLRIPLVAGRAFTDADGPGAAPVAVVKRTLAARLWPAASPLGETLRIGDTTYEVVGVAGDGKYESYTEAPRSYVYLPLEQRYTGSATLHVRSRLDPAAALAAIRAELAAIDPNIALEQAMPLPTLIGFSIFPQRVAAALIGAFGVVGLLLAALGLYGILAFQVSSRTREIGVRMALGAHGANVVRLVMRSGLRLVVVGSAIGLLAAYAATRLLAGLLYGVSPTDPVTFIAVPLLLGGVALLAAYLPARRATRVDPVIALRSE